MRRKKFFYNLITNILLQVVIALYGFVIPKIIIENFGSTVNGLISSITQFLGYIALLQSGVGPVVKAILYKPIAKNDNDEIVNIIFASEKFFKNIAKIFVIYIIILAFIYPLFVSKEFEYFYTFFLIIIISVSIFAEYYFGMTYRLFLQADQKSYVISLINTLSYILSLIVVIILVKFSFGIHFIKFVSALIFVIRPLFQNFYVRKVYNLDFSNCNLDYKLKNKWDGLAQHIASVVHDNTDITILTFFSNFSMVSVYAIYNMVIKVLKTLIESFSNGIDSAFGDMIAKNEIDNLRKKFSVYETLYFSICIILFSSAFVLITPFVKIYTRGVVDANYVQYLFGYIFVVAEYVRAIRAPYNGLVKVAGHFKETRCGAILECVINIVVSLILYFKLGLVGLAIGTLLAMVFRMVEFIFHSNRFILKRSQFDSVRRVALTILETIICVLSVNCLSLYKYTNYFYWIINATVISLTICFIVLMLNYIFYKEDFKEIIKIIMQLFVRKRKINE